MKYNYKKKSIKLIYLMGVVLFTTISLKLNLTYILDNNKIYLIYIISLISILLTIFLLNKFKNKINEVLDYIIFIFNALIFVLILTSFLILPSKVKGSSMSQTYEDGDRVFVNLFNPNYKVDDVVVYDTKTNEDDNSKDKLIIKRIVALKGDKIEAVLIEEKISEHEVMKYYLIYINDELYLNKYGQSYKIAFNSGSVLINQLNNDEYVLKDNEVFLLGDNSDNSLDSRQSGIFNFNNLVGKVIGAK